MAVSARKLLLVLPILALAATAGPAQAAKGPSSFEGTCDFSGLLRQSPPLTNLPQPGEATARAAGSCTGTLTGPRGRVRELHASSAGYFARAQGTTSCGGGSATGAGFIRLRGRRIRFQFSETRGPGTAAIQLTGSAGGSAAGTANVSPDENPAEIAQKCGGEGLREARIDIHLATTPAISG
jgi:hypothetical protein